MARVFLVLILIVACVAGLGFYRGWFNLTVDKDKIQADEKKVLDKVRPGTDKATTPAEQGRDQAPSPVPPQQDQE